MNCFCINFIILSNYFYNHCESYLNLYVLCCQVKSTGPVSGYVGSSIHRSVALPWVNSVFSCSEVVIHIFFFTFDIHTVITKVTLNSFFFSTEVNRVPCLGTYSTTPWLGMTWTKCVIRTCAVVVLVWVSKQFIYLRTGPILIKV